MKLTMPKVSNTTKEDLEELGRLRLRQARALFASRPFVTKLWMSMHGGFPMEWLKKNWEKITKTD